MQIEEKSRLIFMKYALPCAGILVKRGNVSQETVDRLFEIVKKKGKIPKDAEKISAVAFSACSIIAIDSGKKVIDRDIIHEYFLFKHDEMIDKRYEIMGDFDTDMCRTRAGIVLSVTRNKALVKNSFGNKEYYTDFIPDLKENDTVVTHWDFVIEKIDNNTAEKMKQKKEQLCLK